MYPPPDPKIPFRDIKDHADLMDFHVHLIKAVLKHQTYGWSHLENEITYLKSEIAHFLRIQSAVAGVVVDDADEKLWRRNQ